jgi:VanZ family protein
VKSIITYAARVAAWMLAVAITVLSIVPPNLRPETAFPHSIEHASIFLATGLAFGLGYPRRNVSIAILLVIFSGGIEIVQLFVPGRHARLSDFVIDAVAITCGLATMSLVAQTNGSTARYR